ncbi:serine/threonine kinase [Aureococcus anophagefferens]|nr:serine/threonine kinase [Aureococcus anophagefferens]
MQLNRPLILALAAATIVAAATDCSKFTGKKNCTKNKQCNHYAPYVEEDDGVVSEVAQTELVLVFFYALMVFATDNLEQHDGVFSGKVFASLLVVLLASTLLIALWLIILANFSGDDLRSCSRNSRALLDVRRSLSGLVTPRTPKEGGGGDVPVEAGAVQAAPVARI